MPGELIPLAAILMTFGLPIIAVLAHHQRKMAELIHRNQAQPTELAGLTSQIAQMQYELNELRQIVHEQAIALDDRRSLKPTPPQAQLEQRLENGA